MGAGRKPRPRFFKERKAVPIYEYECGKCRRVTEKLQGIHDRPLSRCPSCSGKVHKRMSSGSFVLKGTGFYANDYAGKGNGKEKEVEKPASCPASKGEAVPPACAGCPKAE
jgi:putative FmdB family regulatory protein